MLERINQSYLLIALLLYTLLAFKISWEYNFIYLYAISSVLMYSIVLYVNMHLDKQNYTTFNLALEVFFYVAFFIFLENSISYYYHNNFFTFSESDALFYHNSVKKLISMPFPKAIDYYLGYMGFDDLGIVLLLYPLYLIYPSNITLNIFYLFVAVITAMALFHLARNFLSTKYAFLASLSYSLSSFVLFFHATGLKESFMVMLVVIGFYLFYSFLKDKNIITLILSLLFLATLALFRPALIALILISFTLSTLLANKGGIITKILFVVLVLLLLAVHKSLIALFNSYTAGGIEELIRVREIQGMIKGGLVFTYLVNSISQAIGPLPTLFSPSKILTMFYAPGLIYRVLLAIPFWLGVFFIFKRKEIKLYPLFFFVFLEMFMLVFLIDGLELRITMPHLPFIFVLAFWFMDKFDRNEVVLKRRALFIELFYIALFVVTVMMFYWNFR